MSLPRFMMQFFALITVAVLAVNNSYASTAQPAYWKVEYKGNTSYLLGSIHVGSRDWYPLPKVIMSDMANSDVLVVELDASQASAHMEAQMKLPAGQTLQGNLAPQTYTKLVEHMKSMGFPPIIVANYKPWAAATVLSVLPYLKSGLQPQFGVDIQFLSRAKGRNMPIIELESAQFQIDLLSGIFSDEKMILELIDLPMSETMKLITFWRQGEMEEIEALMHQQMTPQQSKLMLTDRNKNWIKILTPLLRGNKSHFVVVGAAHMAGKNGVPALLKEAGFKVTRVM